MPDNSQHSDYSRYFVLRQKVYLVNMSACRSGELYESLSGVVVSSSADSVGLSITTSGGLDAIFGTTGVTTYKLTSEALGSGIQVLADLIGTRGRGICSFRLHGALEMFQRRNMPRAEVSGKLFHLSENLALDVLKNKCNRIRENLLSHTHLPELVLHDAAFNLSASGIRVVLPVAKSPLQLSLLVIEFDDNLPVCVVAEPVWEQPIDENLCGGFRFIHILKSDQGRINNFVRDELHRSGGTHIDYKRNWVLVDKMVSDVRKPE